ncbi:MAG: LysE family transporter [Paludibacteraceae bacterium]|nr:LysE family transporter [Paludibacteraceae bacterium]MBO7316045.1 LysE family transporter [Paludibacteraceae bacterium]
MLEFILKGIIIGICVSAPVGPIGVLCIQRTLIKGKKVGIITGLGATFSDLVYAMIAGFSLGFISDFITKYQFWIQIVGSVIIMLFGFYIFKSNPVRSLSSAHKQESGGSYFTDFATSFALCISNPMIMFIFIGLFARMGFFTSDEPLYQSIVGIFSILLGAFLWWVTLNSLVDRFRKKINVRGLGLINKLTGTIICVIGLFGFLVSLLK